MDGRGPTEFGSIVDIGPAVGPRMKNVVNNTSGGALAVENVVNIGPGASGWTIEWAIDWAIDFAIPGSD